MCHRITRTVTSYTTSMFDPKVNFMAHWKTRLQIKIFIQNLAKEIRICWFDMMLIKVSSFFLFVPRYLKKILHFKHDINRYCLMPNFTWNFYESGYWVLVIIFKFLFDNITWLVLFNSDRGSQERQLLYNLKQIQTASAQHYTLNYSYIKIWIWIYAILPLKGVDDIWCDLCCCQVDDI